jgi:hypothetical protein
VLAGLACLLLLASVLGGLPYVWCVPMARAQLSCCCQGHRVVTAEHAPGEGDHPAFEAACCEGRRLGRMPTSPAALYHDVWIAPAVLVAVLPLELLFPLDGAPLDRHAFVRAQRPRAGPEPPLFVLHRVYRC